MAPTELSPAETRAQDPSFVERCSLDGLRAGLPLAWPIPADTPPSPKHDYRSHYRYLGWADLEQSADWEQLSDFDLILRLVDFDGLRPVLASLLGWTSARGRTPFDPVSLFLFLGWQLTHSWQRSDALRNLADPRYADYRRLFGFEEEVPTEGGIRYFLTTLGANSTVVDDTVPVALDHDQQVDIAIQSLNQLLAASVALIRDAGLISPAGWNQALVCPDGMIHDAVHLRRGHLLPAHLPGPAATMPSQRERQPGLRVRPTGLCRLLPARPGS
jgi:hypothetical protein